MGFLILLIPFFLMDGFGFLEVYLKVIILRKISFPEIINMTTQSYRNKKILITGCSFIGPYLLERLIKEVKSIKVVNLSREHYSYFKRYEKDIEFYTRDLREFSQAKKIIHKIDIVFHLAADHGGRGYVALQQGKTASNFLLDGSVFQACLEEGVEKIFYASSGCVYPNYLQEDPKKKLFLKENLVAPPYDADNIYGWAKLMGELTLKQYYKDFGLKSAIGRFFTVYGPHASESHAVMASIAKAFIKQNPYEIWGDGNQVRNWTYVEDIVDGILRATEKIDDATPINLGTNERIKVIDMVEMVFQYTGFTPKKILFRDMPTGPLNRVANITLARKRLGWKPKYTFEKGLKKTVEWYISHKDRTQIQKNLNALLY